MEMRKNQEDNKRVKDEWLEMKNLHKEKVFELEAKVLQLEKEVSALREPPFIHTCGSHYSGTFLTSTTIPYESLLYSSTNTQGGGLDVSSGIFTSPHPGTYEATWSMAAHDNHNDNAVDIYLRKNSQDIQESRHQSYNINSNGGIIETGKCKL